MFTVYYTLIGMVSFFIAALVLGAWLRSHRAKENAEHSSRRSCTSSFSRD